MKPTKILAITALITILAVTAMLVFGGDRVVGGSSTGGFSTVAGDNLGNHTATAALNMGSNAVYGTGSVTVASYTASGDYKGARIHASGAITGSSVTCSVLVVSSMVVLGTDGRSVWPTSTGGGGASDERYIYLTYPGDIYASSATFTAIPELVQVVMDSITLTGAFPYQIGTNTMPTAFNIAYSTMAGAIGTQWSYANPAADFTIAPSNSTGTVTALNLFLPPGSAFAVHTTTCPNIVTLPTCWGLGIRYKRN